MDKKQKIFWVLCLNYWLLSLYMSFAGKIQRFLSASIGSYIPLDLLINISLTLTLVFYGLLVLGNTDKLDAKQVIRKWWSITWKYDLLFFLFIASISRYYTPFRLEELVYLIGFPLFANVLIFALIFFRNYITKNVIYLTVSMFSLIVIMQFIRDILNPHRSTFAYSLSQFYGSLSDFLQYIPLVIFVLIIFANWLSSHLSRLLRSRILLSLTIISAIPIFVYTVLDNLWVDVPMPKSDLMQFLLGICSYFAFSLFYLTYKKTKSKA